jgi:hypothetical protein
VLLASIRLAVLTASPQRSYRKRFEPITPAMTGPELMPVVESKRLRDLSLDSAADRDVVVGARGFEPLTSSASRKARPTL